MPMKNWKALREAKEKRGQVAEELKGLLDGAEGGVLTPENETRCTELEGEFEGYNKVISRYERLSELEDEAGGDPEGRNDTGREDLGGEEVRAGMMSEVPEKDRGKYSVLKVMRSQLSGGGTLDGLEAEMSNEIASRSGKPADGIYIPMDLPMAIESRDLTTTTGAGAVGTRTSNTLIGLLRSRIVVASLGATVLTGLRDNLSIPKHTGGVSGAWVAEGVAPSESDITIGQIGLSPNTLAAYTELTKKFIKQTSIDAEMFARLELMNALRRNIDQAVFNGSGSGAEPEGLLQNSSVPTVAIGTNGGAATFAHMVDLESEVAADDADLGQLAYVTSARGRGALKKTVKASGTARYLWEDNEVNDTKAIASNLIPSDLTKGTGDPLTAVLYGNWAEVMIGLWGGIDLLVNPYSLDTSGKVRVTANVEADVAYAHDESFAKLVDLDFAA